MIPEQLVQGGMFINPDNLLDWHNSHSISGSFNKKVFRDKHILCGELGQCGKLLLRLGKKFFPLPEITQNLAGRGHIRQGNKQNIKRQSNQGKQSAPPHKNK